ncbi:MAG: FAD:protein FMN transferase [Thermodesulfovibrionia bacterium]
MYTFCTITVVSPSEEKAREAIEAGFTRIKRIEQLLNFFSSESEITAINKASGGRPVKVSQETLEAIQRAVEIADYTDGAFDPTIAPVIRLWGFSEKSQESSIPSADKIKNALRFVDYRKIKINMSASEVFLEKKGMELDLGGITKGYAADMAIEAIKAKGIKAALVAIAGDIKGFGLKPDLKPWRVGIQNPRLSDDKSEGGEEDIFASLRLKDKAISTSGDYQRFFIKEGKRYHHILDPRKGYSASDVISVSVIAPNGYMADGLSTGIFVLGREKGIKLLESMGFSGIIVDINEEIFITEDLKGDADIEKIL